MTTINVEVCCPICKSVSTTVADSILMANGTRKRYRKCAACESTRSITTREIPESVYQRLLKAVGG